MIDCLQLMGFLGIACACNWCLAFYKKIGVEKVVWDWKLFIGGIVKIALIGAVLVGISFVWSYVPIDLSSVGLEPQTVLSAGILFYFGKAIQDIAQIVKGVANNKADQLVADGTAVEDEDSQNDE